MKGFTQGYAKNLRDVQKVLIDTMAHRCRPRLLRVMEAINPSQC